MRSLPCIEPIFGLLWMGGLVVYLTVFLSPTPWFNKSISLLYFEPYKAPQGYVPFNPCGSIIHHANYTPPTVPNGVDKARLERTWIGWLGTCTQDADGRRFCTTPSVGRPQWNMTFIQPNDTLYPARMPSRVKTKNILVSVIFSSIGFLAFAYIGLPYHIPSLRKRWAFSNTVVYSLRVAIVITGVVSLGTMANTQVSQTELDRFAAVDNFYQQAPCGTTREIKPGLLMQGKRGKAYQVLWVAWLMCYVAAAAGWAFRIHFPKADEPRRSVDSDAELAAKADVEEFSKEVSSNDVSVTTAPIVEGTTTLPISESISAQQANPSNLLSTSETAPTIGSKNPFASAMAAVKSKSPSFVFPGKMKMPEPEPSSAPGDGEKVDGPAFVYDTKQISMDEETRRKEIAKANGLELPSESDGAMSISDSPPEYTSKGN